MSFNYFVVDMHSDRSINQKCDDLTQLMGSVCLPYCLCLTNGNDVLESAFPGHIEIIQTAVENAQKVRNAAIVHQNNDCFFAIPIDCRESPDWFALGVLKNCDTQSASRLVSIASEAMWRKQEIRVLGQSIEYVDRELKRSYQERIWLRELNAKHAKRARSPKLNARHVIESSRRFLNADAVAIHLYPDQDAKHGMVPMIATTKGFTTADVRYLLQRLPKPELGCHSLSRKLEIRVGNAIISSVGIVPLGEMEVLGYVLSINSNTDEDFVPTHIDVLNDVADFLIADGYTTSILSDSERLVLGTLHSMSMAIEARDPYTHGHSERVAQIAVKIAERLSMSEMACQEIYLAGVLHDIGKIGIPDAVLLKPGKLTKEEFSVIQKHPEIGFKIIDELGKLKFALPGILYHHERIDGTGYPHRLKGDEIPIMARILAVADAFDAMTSSRVYRNAMDRTKAGEILFEGRDIQWDANAVDALLVWLEEASHPFQDATPTESFVSSNKRGMLSHALRVLQH